MPRIAAGFGAPASMRSRRRNSAVGALPMATTAPARRSRHKSSAAAERVVPSFCAKRRDARIVERADHLVARGQPRARNAVRDHLGVAEDRRAGGERAARRGDEICAEHDVLRRLDGAAGMDHAHRDVGFFGGKARQVGFGADDGERALVDRRAVAQIGRGLRQALRRGLRHRRPRALPRAQVARSRPEVHPARRCANGTSRAQPLAMSAQPPRRADDGERRAPGVRAALGAAGQMNLERRAEIAARPLRRCAAPWRAPQCARRSRSARRRRRRHAGADRRR